jgi:hypothetical protein
MSLIKKQNKLIDKDQLINIFFMNSFKKFKKQEIYNKIKFIINKNNKNNKIKLSNDDKIIY